MSRKRYYAPTGAELALGCGAVVQLALIVGVVIVIVHFVSKLW